MCVLVSRFLHLPSRPLFQKPPSLTTGATCRTTPKEQADNSLGESTPLNHSSEKKRVFKDVITVLERRNRFAVQRSDVQRAQAVSRFLSTWPQLCTRVVWQVDIERAHGLLMDQLGLLHEGPDQRSSLMDLLVQTRVS